LSKHGKNTLPLQVLKKFRIIYGSMRQHFREIEQSCGVTGSQLWILQEIANEPGIGISELAERLSMHQSNVSHLADKLVTLGLIIKERSKEDQRRVGVCLTVEALALLKNAPGPTEGLLPVALQTLPDSTLRALDKSLIAVIEELHINNDKLAGIHISDM
jgi:DNA-binding MarR family transcriptional regulator